MRLNFYLSKKWYELFASCNVYVCQPDISATSKSEPVYALLAIISSEHTQQRILKKLAPPAHCRLLFITRHTLDVQPLFITSQTASTSEDFSPFLPALYLLWDNFRISEMTSIHGNSKKKTPCRKLTTSTVA